MFSLLLWAASPSIAVLSFVLFSSFLGSSLYTSCVCFGTFVLWDLLLFFFLCFIIYLFFIDKKKKIISLVSYVLPAQEIFLEPIVKVHYI